MRTAASSNNTDVQVMLNSTGWMVVKNALMEQRLQYLEQLVKEDNPDIRGKIKGIDAVFEVILSIKNNATFEKYEPETWDLRFAGSLSSFSTSNS